MKDVTEKGQATDVYYIIFWYVISDVVKDKCFKSWKVAFKYSNIMNDYSHYLLVEYYIICKHLCIKYIVVTHQNDTSCSHL